MKKLLLEHKVQLEQTQRKVLEVEAQNAKLKEVISKYQTQNRRMSPAGTA